MMSPGLFRKPDELDPETEEMKRRLQILGAIENGGTVISTMSPTRDVFVDASNDIPVAAPQRKPLSPKPVPQVGYGAPPDAPPATANNVKMPAAPTMAPRAALSDEDMARSADADSRMRRALEVAGRQMVEGLSTRKYDGPVLTEVTDETGKLQSRKDKLHAEALRKLETDRNQFNADRSYGLAVDKDKADRERQAKEDEWRKSEKDQDQEIAKANNEALMGFRGLTAGLAVKESKRKDAEKADKDAARDVKFDKGVLTLKPGLSDTDTNRAREKVSLWNAALTGMDDLEKHLLSIVADPSRASEADLRGRVGTVSTALNTAQGQGAMSEGEGKRIADTLGADLRSAKGVEAVIASLMGKNPAEAAKVLLASLRGAKDGARKMAISSLSTWGDYAEGKSASTAPQTSGAMVILVDKDGTEYAFAPDRVDAILKAKPDLKRKE